MLSFFLLDESMVTEVVFLAIEELQPDKTDPAETSSATYRIVENLILSIVD